MLEYQFMKNAFTAILLITPAFGLLSTMIVNNRMAFFSDALGHSALTGIAIGILAGFSEPLWSMLLFSSLLAICIGLLKSKDLASTDTIIGVFSTTSVALGIVILSRGGGFSRYTGYLIGDLLSISPAEIVFLGYVLLAVLIFWGLFFNRLLQASVNSSLARSRGINVLLVEILFNTLTAVIVASSIKLVGLLIISSLLVLPGAAARNVAANMSQYHFFSVTAAVFSGVFGLILSFYWGTAAGATIVLGAAACYFITLCLKLQNQ